MEFKSLKVLKREDNQKLYDISDIAFTYNKDIIQNNSSLYTTTEDDEMRLDSICNKIYEDVNQIDFFCSINNI